MGDFLTELNKHRSTMVYPEHAADRAAKKGNDGAYGAAVQELAQGLGSLARQFNYAMLKLDQLLEERVRDGIRGDGSTC